MNIISIQPETSGFGKTIARFDLALTDDLKLYDLKLVEGRGGVRLVYSPNANGRRVAAFAPPLVAEIAALASAALVERLPHARR